MTSIVHRNILKKKFCPKCDHFHGVERSNVPTATGMCLKDPPRVFIVGMVPTAASVIQSSENQEMSPVLRSYYPPVGPAETCAQWTPRTEGEG